jgi:hypothetical protein
MVAVGIVRSWPLRTSAFRAKDSFASETAECVYVARAMAGCESGSR